MMQHIVSAVGGIAVFGVISICLFFFVFTVALIWTFCLKKAHVSSMGALPLRDEELVSGAKGEVCHD